MRNIIERIKKIKVRDKIISAAAVLAVAAILCGILLRVPKADAAFEGLTTTSVSDGLALNVSGTHVIKGTPGQVYTNVSIKAVSGAVIILQDVHIKQTVDEPVIIFGNGYSEDDTLLNSYTLILVGDSVIENTYEGATNPIIKVENNQYTQVKHDEILGDVSTVYTANNKLTITDEYLGVNYNGSLTLINAEKSTSAVLGSMSSANIQSTLPPDSTMYTYTYNYFGGGKVDIEGEPNLNIVNRGAGAAIGGGGAINGGTLSAAGSDNVNISGGTTRILLAPTSFGAGIGGGSAVRQTGDLYAPSTSGLAGAGCDVVITGGSLYIEAKGAGPEFGYGLGKKIGSVYSGTLTDGHGNSLCVYIANVDDDENSAGGEFLYDGIAGSYGEFELEKVLGEEDYTYKVTDVSYSASVRQHIDTLTITTEGEDYIYGGVGYAEQLYDVSGAAISTEDISGKLYFYVPATKAVFYNVNIDSASKQHADIETYKDSQVITTARYGSRIKVTVAPETDYEIRDIYYVKSGDTTQWPLDYVLGNYYFDMPASDVTIYVVTELPSYSITYMNDLGALHGNPTSYTIRDSFTFNDPVVAGMNFLGWEDENGNPVTGVAAGTTGDLIFYATWREILYTVSFVDYDGTLIYSQATTYGGSVTPPADPVREHYRFTGWDKSTDVITESIVVTATYEYDTSNPILPYNINIDSSIVNGQVVSDVSTAYKDDEVIITVTPDRGYTLKEITVKKNNGAGTVISLNRFQSIGGSQTHEGEYKYMFSMPDCDVIVSAEFELINYSITYINVGNNDHGNPSTYTVLDSFTFGIPTKDEYIFDGWFDEDDNQVTEITAGTTGNLVLIGKWTPEVIEYDYRITINRGIRHGVVTSTHNTANGGELIGVSVTPDRGYKLKKLSYILVGDISQSVTLMDSADYVGSEINFYMPEEDIIITAEFEPIVYNIIYVDVDNSNNPSTYTVEDAFQLEVPEKEGYVFDKWYDISANPVTSISKGTMGNKIFIATWTRAPYVPVNYQITVDRGIVNGVVTTDKSEAAEGDMVIVSVKPVKGYVLDKVECIPANTAEAYSRTASMSVAYIPEANGAGTISFDGAMLDENNYVFTMPAQDIIVTAVFKYQNYNITYIDGGTHENPATYTVKDTVNLTDAYKEGYVFKGWFDENGNKVTAIAAGSHEDVVLVGKWEKQKQEESTGDIETPPAEDETDGPSNSEDNNNGQEDSTEPSIIGPDSNGNNNSGSENISMGDDRKPSRYGFICVVSLLILFGALFWKKNDVQEER